MKKTIVGIIMSLCIGTAQAEPNFVKGEILVKFLNENNTAYKTKEYFPGTKIHVISVPEHAEEKVRDALSNNPNVKFTQLNTLHAPVYVPNDPKIGEQWWLNNINALDAMDISEGSGVIVGVCDTGVNPDHEDLQNVVQSGWNFFHNNSDATNYVHQHGTMVSGSIAANTNNSMGVAAHANKVKIIPGRIADDNEGWSTVSRMVACQEYMADNGAKVINLSYSGCCGPGNYEAARYADSKGAVVVWAAGNSNINVSSENIEEQIIVAATNSSNTKTGFSNYGAAIDLAAPGDGVYGLWLVPNQYAWLSGTSFSSPIVAGVAAMVYSKNPGITAQQVRDILYSTATDLGNSNYYGHGLVNALAAVNAVWEPVPEPPTPPEPVCGNNILESGEACDDGNLVNGDGCDSNCNIEVTSPPPPTEDTVNPIINITKPTEGQKVTRLSLKGTISDNVMLDYAEIYRNGNLVKYMNLADKTEARVNYSWRGSEGMHSITIIAVDLAGNETLESRTFEIVGRK